MLNFIATTQPAQTIPLANISGDLALSATGAALLGIQITELENRCKTLLRRIGVTREAGKMSRAGVLPRKVARATKKGTNRQAKPRPLRRE